jgi:flagellar biogenesis protein FliO
MGASGSDLPGFGGSLALSFVSLALVCVVAYAALRWLARRPLGRPDDSIRILGRCLLEPRRTVYLIAAGGRCFLVGVGDGPMSLLAELDESSLPPLPEVPAGASSAVAQLALKLFGKGKR